MKAIASLCFAALLFGCATTHPGNEGVPRNPENQLPIKISAQTIDHPKDESFQLIEVTVENLSDTWLRIHKSEVLIENPSESKLSVVVGNELRDWAQAMDLRLRKDEYNAQILQLALAGVGAAVTARGIQSDDVELASVGFATLMGSYIWAVSDTIRQSLTFAQQVPAVPENHIYQPFSVPGKMFLRRWVLLNKPVGSVVKNLALQIETAERERGVYEIKL